MLCFKKPVCVKIASSIMPGVKMLRQNFVSASNKSPKDKRLKILNLSHFLENLEFFMTFYICCTKHMPTFRAQFHKINLVVTFQFLSFPEIFQTSFSKQVRTFLLSICSNFFRKKQRKSSSYFVTVFQHRAREISNFPSVIFNNCTKEGYSHSEVSCKN